ncbi:MAG: hypothetical protein Q7V57_01680 [Actinomycetota bacterium]|nr:hypothetical protein [Actinomycetota bacterium]
MMRWLANTRIHWILIATISVALGVSLTYTWAHAVVDADVGAERGFVVSVLLLVFLVVLSLRRRFSREAHQ